MSYLLMQIFVCLLIAGLIGLLIGWLLRGGCKNKLRDNDDKWNSELEQVNGSWRGQVQSLTSEKKSNIDKGKLELSRLNDELDLTKKSVSDLELDWNNKLINTNTLWKKNLPNLFYGYQVLIQLQEKFVLF